MNKRILITGGSAGIGFSVIENLLKDKDVEVILTCSRHEERNQELEKIGEGRVIALTADLAEKDKVELLIIKAIELSVDIVILNAVVTGVSSVDGNELSESYIRAVNQESPIQIINGLAENLRALNGLVIFMSSSLVHAEVVPADMSLYMETKREVEKYISKVSDLKINREILFLSVSPKSVKTRLHESIIKSGDLESEHYQRTKLLMAEQKLRDPDIIAKILCRIVDSRSIFNKLTGNYDIPIKTGEYYEVSEEEYVFWRQIC